MGLAGQKEKQRISDDPNNLNWSKDQSKFGFKMLQKMGWAPGKGLGVNEDGKQEHIKIKLKDNTLGVGATKKNSDNWLGNTDAFSRLLADLNSQPSSETSSLNDDQEEEEEEKKEKKKEKKKKSKKEKKEKKSKKEEKKKEKKRKRDDEEDKEKKKKKKSEKENGSTVVLRNAARAKFLRAKRMATNSEDKSRLNEILGIKSSSSTTKSSNQGFQTIETSTSFMAAFTV